MLNIYFLIPFNCSWTNWIKFYSWSSPRGNNTCDNYTLIYLLTCNYFSARKFLKYLLREFKDYGKFLVHETFKINFSLSNPNSLIIQFRNFIIFILFYLVNAQEPGHVVQDEIQDFEDFEEDFEQNFEDDQQNLPLDIEEIGHIAEF